MLIIKDMQYYLESLFPEVTPMQILVLAGFFKSCICIRHFSFLQTVVFLSIFRVVQLSPLILEHFIIPLSKTHTH